MLLPKHAISVVLPSLATLHVAVAMAQPPHQPAEPASVKSQAAQTATRYLKQDVTELRDVDRSQLKAPVVATLDRGHLATFPQTFRGLPVEGAKVMVRVDKQGQVRWARNSTVAIDDAFSIAPAIAEHNAEAIAATVVPNAGSAQSRQLVVRARGGKAVLAYSIVFPFHDTHMWRVTVSASTGAVLSRDDLALHAVGGTPRGSVFLPSPAHSSLTGANLESF